MINKLRLFCLSIIFAFILMSTNVACGANVEIVSSEDISAKIASIGGLAKSVRITGISRNGAVIVGSFMVAKPTHRYKFFRYVTNSNKFEILNPILEKSFAPDGSDIGSGISPLRISADGTVIAGAYLKMQDLNNHVFVFSDSNGFKDIGDFGLGKAIISVNGLSADGSLLVGEFTFVSHNNWQAFKYSEEKGFVDLQGMGKEHAFAEGVSSDGSIIVGNYRDGV